MHKNEILIFVCLKHRIESAKCQYTKGPNAYIQKDQMPIYKRAKCQYTKGPNAIIQKDQMHDAGSGKGA